MGHRLVRPTFICGLLVYVMPLFLFAEQSVLARRNEVTAYLVECEKNVARIEIDAPEGELFSDETSDVGIVLRSLKFILPQACVELEKVVVSGKANGELWFAAATRPGEDWRFTSLYAAPQ